MGIQNINTTQATLSIRSRLPKIQIDQQQCFNESGLMDYQTLTDYYTSQGVQAAFQGIERRVSEGRMMGAIENGGNPISQIARSNSFDQAGYTIAATPRSRPRIMIIEGYIDISI